MVNRPVQSRYALIAACVFFCLRCGPGSKPKPNNLVGIYKITVTLFTEELDFLSASDKEWIMGKALANWLNWPLPN